VFGKAKDNPVLSETVRFSTEACWSEVNGAALKSNTTDISFRDKNYTNCKEKTSKSKHELNFMSTKSSNKNHAKRHCVPESRNRT
jgi:hypothetical protein